MKLDNPEDKRVAFEIFDYLKKYPYAGDTLEGIAEWWLERNYIDETIDRIARALTWLGSRGIIIEKIDSKGMTYYKLIEDMNEEELLCGR